MPTVDWSYAGRVANDQGGGIRNIVSSTTNRRHYDENDFRGSNGVAEIEAMIAQFEEMRNVANTANWTKSFHSGQMVTGVGKSEARVVRFVSENGEHRLEYWKSLGGACEDDFCAVGQIKKENSDDSHVLVVANHCCHPYVLTNRLIFANSNGSTQPIDLPHNGTASELLNAMAGRAHGYLPDIG